jgi:LPS O-antigen subunit length determinant protein (WzzB/FepE family)
MSTTTSTVMVVKPDATNFLDESVDLKKLLKALSKVSAKAIEVLVKQLESTDDKARERAAKLLLEMQVTVAEKISADQMQRLIAQVKLTRPTGTLVPLGGEGGGQKQRPLVDFGNIQEIA